MATEKQILANRANALRSTGPKTPEGKARSRGNALKHGMAGGGVVLSRSDQQRLDAHLKDLTQQLEPIDPLEKILVTRMALAAMRLEKCVQKDFATTARRQRRALTRWQRRQWDEVEQLASQLEDDPAGTVDALTASATGCAWLLAEWDALLETLESGHAWTLDEAAHAARLLGETPAVPVDEPAGPAATFWNPVAALHETAGTDAAALETLQAAIAAEQTRLEALREQHERDHDAPARAEVETCAAVDTSPAGGRLHRYETAAELSLHRNLKQLISQRRIEPEEHSIKRWHLTGRLKPRRWNGLNYEPTNPYYSSNVEDHLEEAQAEAPRPAPAQPAAPAAPPAAAYEAAAAQARFEADSGNGTPPGACGSSNPPAAPRAVPGAADRPGLAGSRPVVSVPPGPSA